MQEDFSNLVIVGWIGHNPSVGIAVLPLHWMCFVRQRETIAQINRCWCALVCTGTFRAGIVPSRHALFEMDWDSLASGQTQNEGVCREGCTQQPLSIFVLRPKFREDVG